MSNKLDSERQLGLANLPRCPKCKSADLTHPWHRGTLPECWHCNSCENNFDAPLQPVAAPVPSGTEASKFTFGQRVEGVYASDDNPRKIGFFVRESKVAGGDRIAVVTDGKRDFWTTPVTSLRSLPATPGEPRTPTGDKEFEGGARCFPEVTKGESGNESTEGSHEAGSQSLAVEQDQGFDRRNQKSRRSGVSVAGAGTRGPENVVARGDGGGAIPAPTESRADRAQSQRHR